MADKTALDKTLYVEGESVIEKQIDEEIDVLKKFKRNGRRRLEV